MLISKTHFVKYVNSIKESFEELERLEEALAPFMDKRLPNVTMGSGLRDAFIDMLVTVSECGDEDDIFMWWLFDSSKKEITITEGNRKGAVYNVETPEELYDYLYDTYHHDD